MSDVYYALHQDLHLFGGCIWDTGRESDEALKNGVFFCAWITATRALILKSLDSSEYFLRVAVAEVWDTDNDKCAYENAEWREVTIG
jgi:hypothetical protein